MIITSNENETANILENHKKFIMSDWLENVRAEIAVARLITDEQICNHFSFFMNTLIDALRSDETPGLIHKACLISKNHSEQRFKLRDYNLDLIIHEYHLLRKIIFETLIIGRETTVTEKDRKIINSMIDKSIVFVASEFTKKETEKLNKMKKEFEEALAKLKLRVTSRDRFLSVASHELKNPLTTLFLQVQLRKRQLIKGNMSMFESDKLKEMLDADLKQLSGLNRLMDDMLDIGRFRTGRLQLNKELLNLSEIAHAVFERLKAQIEEKCSKFDCGVEENIMVLADVGRVEQAIFNILTHAMKYGEYKLLSVKVFTDKGKGKVYIDIRNKEIENSEIAKKFQRKFLTDQWPQSLNEDSELALGLSVAKEIIVAHGGEILIDSEEGVGPTFTVRLPLVLLH